MGLRLMRLVRTEGAVYFAEAWVTNQHESCSQEYFMKNKLTTFFTSSKKLNLVQVLSLLQVSIFVIQHSSSARNRLFSVAFSLSINKTNCHLLYLTRYSNGLLSAGILLACK